MDHFSSETPANPGLPEARPSVTETLRLQRERMSGEEQTVLPVSGIVVFYPSFINHDAVLVATKQAGKNRDRVGAVMIAQHCRFGPQRERMSVSDITSLLHNGDVVHLVDILLSENDGAKKDEAGN